MTIIQAQDAIADPELALLTRLLAIVDLELKAVLTDIDISNDAESDGLLDVGEFLIGTGFVAIQRYITSIHTGLGKDRGRALTSQPHINDDVPLAQLLNATANYWKHSDEWYETTLLKNKHLGDRALDTISVIERVTPVADYTCSNVLAAILNKRDLALSGLLPMLMMWRNEVLKLS
ncbi:hypothetical protein ASF69_01700 [Rhizobium sp. Leaf311]|uniref:hypothetical protein n=1 Tax=Rhizobium sp. Leaf311 TaxID=1736332 RepID=UPI0007157522|nr:hypothetical protein [Rhizobium sp. Leaf311]KQQ61164.1 hypothetical protein ASF69_01700 [Rhizobium sp. Leaf311]